MERLGRDIRCHVARFVPLDALHRMRLVCRAWAALWKEAAERQLKDMARRSRSFTVDGQTDAHLVLLALDETSGVFCFTWNDSRRDAQFFYASSVLRRCFGDYIVSPNDEDRILLTVLSVDEAFDRGQLQPQSIPHDEKGSVTKRGRVLEIGPTAVYQLREENRGTFSWLLRERYEKDWRMIFRELCRWRRP